MAPTGTTNRMPRPLATPPLANMQQADGNGVDHGVHEGGGTQIGQQAPAADDDGDAGGEIDHAGPQEQLRAALRRAAASAPENTIQRVKRRRNQQPVEIDQADDAPGEIGRSGRNGGD